MQLLQVVAIQKKLHIRWKLWWALILEILGFIYYQNYNFVSGLFGNEC